LRWWLAALAAAQDNSTMERAMGAMDFEKEHRSEERAFPRSFVFFLICWIEQNAEVCNASVA
jgi:hypothetical protein